MSADPTGTRNLVKRLEEAMNSRQLDLLEDILTPDFARHSDATPDVHVSSREELSTSFGTTHRPFLTTSSASGRLSSKTTWPVSGRRT